MKWALVVVAVAVVSFLAGKMSVDVKSQEDIHVDTVTWSNISPTIVSPIVAPEVPAFVVAKLPLLKCDTVVRFDSVEVVVPRSAYVFEEDSVYRAEVSGFAVTLDKMQVFSKTTTQTRVVVQKSRSRWGLGLQVGYGATTSNGLKLQPYIGIGVSYNLITW